MTGCRIHLAESEGRTPPLARILLLTIRISSIFFTLMIRRSEAVL
jgi:hypothetical protein